ncbi:MAG: UDP-N-acetylmuramoyl-L-alanine--D-glutamate ligase [Eggerthellaceae bacterium]|jgi:UDP-N-acetylmuramoylalanine--D-glutamate ligase
MENGKRAMLLGSHAAFEDLGDVLILGLGKSATAAADYCLSRLGGRVRSVSIAAGARSAQAEEKARGFVERGAKVAFDCYEIHGAYDLAIASPGISQFEDFYRSAEAASSEIISEVEFAWRESPSSTRWVGITGTNGKTTTTSLTTHLLNAAGIEAVSVGNIGDTCLDAVAEYPADGPGPVPARVLVAEVSSFQLASTRLFAPQIAVLLNITPDHISWHKSFEAYAAAKRKVYANLASVPGSLAILGATDEQVRICVRAMKAQGAARGFAYLPIGAKAGLQANMHDVCGSERAAYLREDGMLCLQQGEAVTELVDVDELQIKGRHNAANALAAASAALELGAEVPAVREGLRSFAPLAHRIEPCGSIAGVACYNDSKATNVDATLKALAAFAPKRPIALLGGFDKGTPLDSLVKAAQEHCKAVVCFGAAAPRFEKAFADAVIPVIPAQGMESALDAALDIAEVGDIVLLSPACSSFDEFANFEERGDVFKKLVTQRVQADGDQGAADGR